MPESLDTTGLLELLKRRIPEIPVWNPMAKDQTAEFDRWKEWSSRMRLFNDVLGAIRMANESNKKKEPAEDE